MTDDPLFTLGQMLDRVAAIKVPTSIRRGREVVVGGEKEQTQLPPTEKIAQLESYLLLTAEARQIAEQSRLAASNGLWEADRELEEVEGWEMYLNSSMKNATGVQIAEAKRRAAPELSRRRQRLDWLVKRFSEQIRRLEQDDAATSRAYSMITGS